MELGAFPRDSAEENRKPISAGLETRPSRPAISSFNNLGESVEVGCGAKGPRASVAHKSRNSQSSASWRFPVFRNRPSGDAANGSGRRLQRCPARFFQFTKEKQMTNEAKQTPAEAGATPAFPPEVAEGSTIGSATPTTASDGTIGSAQSTCENLADVVPNADE
jgi:hypothetical protein